MSVAEILRPTLSQINPTSGKGHWLGPSNQKGHYMTRIVRKLPLTVFANLVVTGSALAHPDTEAFVQSAFLEASEIVDCTLEAGSGAQYHQTTVS
jgi:hypothetical protein